MLDRVSSGAIDFDAALVAGDTEELLRAAGLVIDCDLPIAPARADAVSNLTGWPLMVETYIDAAHAVRTVGGHDAGAGGEALTDNDERIRELQAARLREARELRGFESARSAQLRFGWSSAYGHHENGTRGIGRAYREYARAFQVNPAWILGHSEERDGDPDNEALARIEEKIDQILDRIERIERRLDGSK